MNTTYNIEYSKALKKWQLVNDCVNDTVEDNNAQLNYIVRDAHVSDDAYNAFSSRAVFTNYVGATLDVLTGSANYKPYTFTGANDGDLPEAIAYAVDSFGESGVGYSDHLKVRQREVFSVGRCGVWVSVDGDNSGRAKAEQIKATARIFKAHQIEDWAEKKINGVKRLNYIKLSEQFRTIERQSNGTFEWKDYKVIYELYLDSDGLFAFDVDDCSSSESKYTVTPTLGNGQRLDFIPFQFYGSQDNTPDVDIAPMYKLSRINIGIYNSDANLRQATHLFAVPTATFALGDGVSNDDFRKYNGLQDGQSPVLGGTAYVGCEIKLAQMSLDSILLEVIKRDIEAMASIGAQLVTVGQNETAEAARIRKSSGMVNLSDMVENIEQGDRNVISWMMMFNNASGQPDEFVLELNRKFYDDRIDPQMLQQLFTAEMMGRYPGADLFEVLKENGITKMENYLQYKENLGTDVKGKTLNLGDEEA